MGGFFFSHHLIFYSESQVSCPLLQRRAYWSHLAQQQHVSEIPPAQQLYDCTACFPTHVFFIVFFFFFFTLWTQHSSQLPTHCTEKVGQFAVSRPLPLTASSLHSWLQLFWTVPSQMALNFPDFEIPSLSQIWAETSAGPSGSFPLISGSSRQFIIFFSAEARQRRGSRISAQFIMRVVAYQGVCVCARDVCVSCARRRRVLIFTLSVENLQTFITPAWLSPLPDRKHFQRKSSN